MATPMMKCGHAANATNNKTGLPSCVICMGIHPGSEIVDESPPDLSGRIARCSYYGTIPRGQLHESNTCRRGEKCMCERPSSPELAFFSHTPSKTHDQFYCGCWGWD